MLTAKKKAKEITHFLVVPCLGVKTASLCGKIIIIIIVVVTVIVIIIIIIIMITITQKIIIMMMMIIITKNFYSTSILVF